MLIYLGFNLVTGQVIYLPYPCPGCYRLAEDGIQKAEFSIDRSLDGKVFLPFAYHLHVLSHVLQALFHLLYLHRPVQAVLQFPFPDEIQPVFSQPIVLLCLQPDFPCNQLFIIQGFLLSPVALAPAHLHFKLQPFLLDGQFLLLHLYHCVAQNILLFGKFRFGIEDLEVEIVVAEPQYGIPFADAAAFLPDYLFDYPAFERAYLDGDHRLDLAADADIVIEFPLYHIGCGDGICVDAQCRGTVAEYKP